MTLLELTLETAIKEAGEFKDVRLSKEDAEYILSMLKEQEAVPVIQREIMHLLIWCCGSCGVAITEGDKFCRMCGRRMKWNG
jgi:rubrerythrin